MKKMMIGFMALTAFASFTESANADDNTTLILREINILNKRVATLENLVKEPDIHVCYCEYQSYTNAYYAILRGHYLDSGNAKRSECEKLIARAQECK